MHPSELLRNTNVRNAFHIPARSVMAGAKPQRPRESTAAQQIVVRGARLSRTDVDRRRVMRKTQI